jgi:hypothetical protein
MNTPASWFLCLLLPSLAPAQDLVGLSFGGQAVGIDSRTAAASFFIASGLVGCNAMARSGGTIWVAEQTAGLPTSQFHLALFDERTNTGTRVFTNTGHDVRALATDIHGGLLAIVQGTTSDTLMRVNTTNGAFAAIGSLGFPGVQAMARVGGIFYAWDTTAGLLRVDASTGVATDVNPGLGTGGIDVQFLAAMGDGRVFGGRHALHAVDLQTGALALVGTGTWSDLRGCEERFGSTTPFGSSCAGTTGTPLLTFNSLPYPGTPYQLQSNRHLGNGLGILCFGSSRTSHGTTPLPFDVDPLLGTSGCLLQVSPAVTQFGVASAAGVFVTPIPIPPGFGGQTFYAQHVALEAGVPGGWSFSNGVEIRIGY